MANYPSDLKYTKDHEWARVDGDVVRIGVTAYAVEMLGDITLVDLPKVGAKLEERGRFGDIESVKTVSELFSPIAGEVVEVNSALDGSPELVNEDPYDKAWMIEVRAEAGTHGETMDAAAYRTFVAAAGH